MFKITPILLMPLFVFAGELSPERQAILDQFNSDQEPTAIEALWTADHVFKVGVIDNGRVRDGYAEYVCLEISHHGMKGQDILVRVVDYERLVANGDWVNLGTFFCD